jgi:hypothetical protein
MSQTCPELFSFSKILNVTIQAAAQAPQFQDLFYLPMSPEAYDQFLDLSMAFHDLQLHSTEDVWSYIWGSASFSSHKAYK